MRYLQAAGAAATVPDAGEEVRQRRHVPGAVRHPAQFSQGAQSSLAVDDTRLQGRAGKRPLDGRRGQVEYTKPHGARALGRANQAHRGPPAAGLLRFRRGVKRRPPRPGRKCPSSRGRRVFASCSRSRGPLPASARAVWARRPRRSGRG